jgi:16S rRNA (cytosine1402-N4)-methyltransferase
MQLDAEGRGFSFRRDEPLDMRMDRTRGDTAAELLRTAAEDEIANAIFQFGEERYSRRVARAIVNARRERPIATTGELATIVRRAVPHRGYQRIDPATRTFQGLRIWVNRELDGLDGFLAAAAARLLRGARLAVITFHSLEDRIVKRRLRALAGRRGGDEPPVDPPQLRLLTKHVVVPGDEERARNPRARSARLRAAERL